MRCLGLAILLPLPARALTISYALADPAMVMPGGWLDPGSPDGMARGSALFEVKAYVESVIKNPGAITISLSTFTSPAVPTLASGAQFYTNVGGSASGVVMGDAMAEILAGVPVPGPNGVISFNTAKTTYLGSDPGGITPSMTDFRSIILHEMTHVLGWASFMKPDDKTSALTDFLTTTFPAAYTSLGEVFSVYDTLLVDSMGFAIILPGGTANAAALPMGGAKIASTNAMLAYGGDLVPTAVVPFIDGDLTHTGPAVSSTMNPTLAGGAIERTWTAVDLGVLQDLGYTIPEPSSALMAFAGWVLLCGARRRRDGTGTGHA